MFFDSAFTDLQLFGYLALAGAINFFEYEDLTALRRELGNRTAKYGEALLAVDLSFQVVRS
jgi:hypothetical protein